MEERSLHSSYVALCVFNAFSCYTAIMLNVCIIHAIRKTLSLPKTLRTFLLSLAVSDLGIGLLVQPLNVVRLVIKLEQNSENNSFYGLVLAAFDFTSNLFAWASFFGVMALSVDRFFAVHLYLAYKEIVTNKRVVAVVISIWVFSASLSFISLWTPGNVSYMIFAIIDVVCEITATVLNFKIYWTVKSHINQVHAMELAQPVQSNEMVSIARLRKFAILSAYVYFVFLICYLPHTCMFWILSSSSDPSTVQKVFIPYTLTLVFLNSSLNPLIYCLKMRNIRLPIINILRKACSANNCKSSHISTIKIVSNPNG